MLALNYPAAKAITPEVVIKIYLQKFNAISNTFFNLANMAAPLVGGALLAIKNIDFSEFLLINALSYIVALCMNFLIPYKKVQDEKNNAKESIVTSTLIGFKYVKNHSNLLMYMLAMGFLIFAMLVFYWQLLTLHIIFFREIQQTTVFLTVSAVGGLLGGVWFTFQKRKIKPERIYWEQLFYGIMLVFAEFSFH